MESTTAVVGYCGDSDLGIIEGYSIITLFLTSWSVLVLSSLILLKLVNKCVYLTFSYCGQMFSSI